MAASARLMPIWRVWTCERVHDSIACRAKLSGWSSKATTASISPAIGADDGPEGQLHLLVGGHADAAPKRHDGIEHEAVASAERRTAIEGRRVGDRAATAYEGTPVGLSLRVPLDAGSVGDEMRHLDIRIAGRALAPPREDHFAARRNLGFDEHLRECRVGGVIQFRGEHKLGEGSHLDVAVDIAVIVQRDTPALAIAFRNDDALHLRAQRADGLGERRLVVGEVGKAALAFRAPRLDRRGPPFAGGDIAQEDEGAVTVLGRIAAPARDRELVPAAVARARWPRPSRNSGRST